MVRAEALTPGDLAAVAWRYKAAAIVMAVVCGMAAYGYSLYLPNQFTATTFVLVEDEGPSATYVRSTVNFDLEARLRTLRDQVLSRTTLQQVMSTYGLFTTEATWEKRLSRMRDQIDIEVSGSDSFRISFTNESPEVARDVTNTLADLFIANSSGTKARQSEDTNSLLNRRLEDLADQLRQSEQAIADFKAEHMGSLPTQMSNTQGSLDWAKGQLSTTITDLALARDRRQTLERLAATSPDQVGPRTARQVAMDLLATTSETELERQLASQPAAVRLEALKIRRERLLGRVTARHPDVRLLELEIASLELQAGAEGFGAVSGAAGTESVLTEQLTTAERQVRLLEQRRNELQAQIIDLEARLVAAPAVEQELYELEREHGSLTDAYKDLQGRRSEASLAGGVDEGRWNGFKVLDPAVTPQRKSSPRRAFFLVGGCLFGLLLGLGGGMAREVVVQPVYTASDIERHIGVPVLSSIPSFPGAKSRRLSGIATLIATVGGPALGALASLVR